MFAYILTYLKSPLVILGLLLLLAFGVFRFLHKIGKIEKLPIIFEEGLPHLALTHGYVLGVVFVLVGITLKHNEMTHAQQEHALMMIGSEYSENMAAIRSLNDNISQLLQSHQQISDKLRSKDSKILATIFPSQSTPKDNETPINKIVDAAFKELKESALLDNSAAMSKFYAVKDQYKPFLNTQLENLSAMKDADNIEYSIKDDFWLAHKEIFVEIEGKNPRELESSIKQMRAVRVKYNTVLNQTADYFSEVNDFLGRTSYLSNGDVYEILKKEREVYEKLKTFKAELVNQLKTIGQINRNIKS